MLALCVEEVMAVKEEMGLCNSLDMKCKMDVCPELEVELGIYSFEDSKALESCCPLKRSHFQFHKENIPNWELLLFFLSTLCLNLFEGKEHFLHYLQRLQHMNLMCLVNDDDDGVLFFCLTYLPCLSKKIPQSFIA